MKYFYSIKFVFKLIFSNLLIPLVYVALLTYSVLGFYLYSIEKSLGSGLFGIYVFYVVNAFRFPFIS
ncbi:hypothetical protein H4683_003593 [Filibacter limicola]|uniref:Uncharacterized protein n=1 Tax=Sporosarcina limicola TaxID=34101 RepID=A0A927MM32_9BACL|nr:hypothetical protein [Sporosarcina limicola]